MAAAKCRICGSKLDTATAHFVITYDKKGKAKKAYYCSYEEYQKEEQRKEKAAADKDKVYRLICDIVNRKEIINTILYKEWALWNKVASNEKIGNYLEDNQTYLSSVISRLEDVEFKKIRYLSAILKDKLGDYRPRVEEKKTFAPIVQEEHYETKFKTKQRTALLDLEEDCDE